MELKLKAALILFLALACSGASHAQLPSCGIANSTTRMPPPATGTYGYLTYSSDPGYTGSFFSPPNTVGATFTDSLSTCPIKQLTYGATEFSAAARHEYSNMSPINANDTLIELFNFSSNWFIADLSGNIIVPIGNVPWSGGIGARWDATNPLVAYYNLNGILYKGTIPSNYAACKPTCTITSTVQHDFTATYINNVDGLNFGGGEGDIQTNQPNSIVLCGIQLGGTAAGVCQASSGTVDVFIYTINTDTVGTKFHITGANAALFDNAKLTPNGNVVINWDASGGVCASGPCFHGLEYFNGSTMAWISSPWYYQSTHYDTTYMGSTYYIVAVDSGPYVCGEQGVVAVNLANSAATCIINLLPWTSSIHVGAAEDGNGWISVGHVDYEASGAASYPVATNWNLNVQSNGLPSTAGYWGTYTGEEIVMKVDASQVYRMTWNRTRPTNTSYWKSPRTAISRDAKYIVYDSDYGQGVNTPDTDYTDVFLIATGISATSSSSLYSGFKCQGCTLR